MCEQSPKGECSFVRAWVQAGWIYHGGPVAQNLKAGERLHL